MDGLFKQKLLGLRSQAKPRTFGEALLGDTTWLKKAARPAAPAPIPPKEVYSEKVQVIESLERFVEEKTQNEPNRILKIDGGEVAVRSEPGWESVASFSSFEGLKAHLKLQKELLDIVLAGKVQGQVKAIFVSEKFRPYEESKGELKSGFINELIVGFPVKTAEFFERMILAMKFDPSEVIIFPVEGTDESDYSSDVMTVAAYFKPEVIITLGATATSRILKSSDRLTQLHGKFHARKVADKGTFQVVPLFHPSIIETNQNMKRTAWTDMQIIMKHLKKLP